MIIALDFDGTCCEFAFPDIGRILPQHQRVIDQIRKFKSEGHTIVLWTCREDKEERKYLTEAVNWCRENSIPIDFANGYPNPGWSGFPVGKVIPCRKLMADVYIDDKVLHIDHV